MAKKKKHHRNSLTPGVAQSMPQEDVRSTIIMFVDVIGASEVSNHLSVVQYKDFVTEFKALFEASCKAYLSTWLPDLDGRNEVHSSARGDEAVLLIYPRISDGSFSPLTDLATYIDVAINISLELKRRWLSSQHNKSNIESGIVPIELAVGIHYGQTCLAHHDENGTLVQRPEGYAINLAKRIEGFSRTGRYTRIFVSEAAHGALSRLPDEKTYLFDEPKPLAAKGFSREIRAFEVMHHFLPTDWTDTLEARTDNPASKTLLRVPDSDQLRLCIDAYELNPTNIWLAEECVRQLMLTGFDSLSEADRENAQRLRETYTPALEIIEYLAQGDQRDPGILMIQGLIYGECLDFERERRCYADARRFKQQLSILDWYEGYSLSYEVWVALGADKLDDRQLTRLRLEKLVATKRYGQHEGKVLREMVERAIQLLKQAAESARWSAWIHYTYGCELAMWGDPTTAIGEVVRACQLLPDVAKDIPTEPYLEKLRGDSDIAALQHT